jgi:hypothetical protein
VCVLGACHLFTLNVSAVGEYLLTGGRAPCLSAICADRNGSAACVHLSACLLVLRDAGICML